MGWQPPQEQDMEALRWLGKVGAFAAMVNILRQFLDTESRYAWWQKVLHSMLIGLLSLGMGAMLITTWPAMPFLMLLGLASMGGYLGSDFIMWLAFKAFGTRQFRERS